MKYPIELTLKDLRDQEACVEGYNKAVRGVEGVAYSQEDEEGRTHIKTSHSAPFPLSSILESNGLDDALWALRCVPEYSRDARLFAVWCARQVQHLMKDSRSINALDVAERFANGLATDDEWDAAGAAARAAVRDAARAAARDASWDAARAAARAASWDAARAAARAASWDAARAAAMAASWDADRAASWDAAWAAQREMFAAMCEGKAPWQKTKKGV